MLVACLLPRFGQRIGSFFKAGNSVAEESDLWRDTSVIVNEPTRRNIPEDLNGKFLSFHNLFNNTFKAMGYESSNEWAITNAGPNLAVMWPAFLLRTWEVLGSNLGPQSAKKYAKFNMPTLNPATGASSACIPIRRYDIYY